jgi:hypothetical protein
MNKLGKHGKVNQQANIKLKRIYLREGITSCEIGLEGCTGQLYTGFAHKHKRVWYYRQPELLSSFNETVIACSSCHSKLERNDKLTEETFNKLRP